MYLAAVYPQSGGTYEYGYRVLHPWLGFAAGWMFLASKLAAAGTVALGFAHYPPWIAGSGLGFCLALASSLSLATMFTGMGLLATGFLVRAALRRTTSRR